MLQWGMYVCMHPEGSLPLTCGFGSPPKRSKLERGNSLTPHKVRPPIDAVLKILGAGRRPLKIRDSREVFAQLQAPRLPREPPTPRRSRARDTMSSDAEGAQGGITSELRLGRFPHERLEVMLAGESVNVRRSVLRITLQEQHDSVRPCVQHLLERAALAIRRPWRCSTPLGKRAK